MNKSQNNPYLKARESLIKSEKIPNTEWHGPKEIGLIEFIAERDFKGKKETDCYVSKVKHTFKKPNNTLKEKRKKTI